MADTDHVTDVDLLDRGAATLVDLFNAAAPDHAPDLEWFAMGHDRETGDEQFVLEAERYIDRAGLAALRDHGRVPEYIEAYAGEDSIYASIEVPVRGEIPQDRKAE